uniref:Uncharacterized protein n=1 Tax=Oryza brachyantha TaxID=4533 RepID=J3MSY4_ORYBR
MPNMSNNSGCSTGYCTVSCSSCLTSSRPPMSSHDTLGTSTIPVSRRAEGFVTSTANLRWSMQTVRELRISTLIVSSSMSIRSSFSRMHCMAASEHSEAMSEPTNPWVSLPTRSRSTSSARGMFFVCMRRRSRRPKRRSAGSRLLGRLVAPMTTTCPRERRPSMRVSSCDTTRRSTSPCAFSRLGAIESTSSRNMIDGACSSASANTFRRFASLSPATPAMISGPFTTMKWAPDSAAMARARSVFPVPGGP